MRPTAIFATLLLLVAACGGSSDAGATTIPSEPVTSDTISNAPPTIARQVTVPPITASPTTIPTTSAPPTTMSPEPSICELEFEQTTAGVVAGEDLFEISGLVASRSQAGVLWAHNDSGDEARIYAISTTGEDLGSFLLAEAEAKDWEDIAIGTGPDGVDYVYVADIGDNAERRADVIVYRVSEPVIGSSPTVDATDALTLTYPDGPHDAETLLVDPVRGDLIIVTKESDGRGGVYGVEGSPPWGGEAELTNLGIIDLGFLNEATGGDVSASGENIVVRTYGAAYGWSRAPGSSLAEGLMAEPCRIASVPELQGEAIGFGDGEAEFFTVAEGENQPLYLFNG